MLANREAYPWSQKWFLPYYSKHGLESSDLGLEPVNQTLSNCKKKKFIN